MSNHTQLLYRGYGVNKYDSHAQSLTPRELGEFAHTNKHDGSINRDGSADYGHSARNAVLYHQFNQLGLPTSGISTTPHMDRAKVYALGKDRRHAEGIILVIDRLLLAAHGVKAYVVKEWVMKPSVLEDDEIILVSISGGPLPLDIVVDQIHVAGTI